MAALRWLWRALRPAPKPTVTFPLPGWTWKPETKNHPAGWSTLP